MIGITGEVRGFAKLQALEESTRLDVLFAVDTYFVRRIGILRQGIPFVNLPLKATDGVQIYWRMNARHRDLHDANRHSSFFP